MFNEASRSWEEYTDYKLKSKDTEELVAIPYPISSLDCVPKDCNCGRAKKENKIFGGNETDVRFLSDPGVPGVRSMGPVVSNLPCWDLTDVTLADEDTKSIPTDNVNRAIPGNVAMHVTQPGGQHWNQCKWRHLMTKFWTWWPNFQLVATFAFSASGQNCNHMTLGNLTVWDSSTHNL